MFEQQKCHNCGARHIEKPIWKGQELGEPFSFDKLIWKNLFRMDLVSILLLASMLFLIWSYNHDTEACRELLEKPCEFVKLNQEACIQIERQKTPIFIMEINKDVRQP